MDLKENELEWLSTHMGHNLNVHREYYRLPENTLQTAKVGKLLLAIESGIQKYKGKSLDDITELSDIEEDEEEEGEHMQFTFCNLDIWPECLYSLS